MPDVTLLTLALSFMIIRSITRPLKAALDDILPRGGDLNKCL
ncbi:hypothetical protein [Vreelandella malpeensis]|nr:hypothetical protein [Halomonas malpeensis]